MQVLCCNAAALAVAWLFYSWRGYCAEQARRGRKLRQRVAYMLWAMARQVV
jgi:hypothetical protein